MEKNVMILADFVSFGDVAMATARTILTRLGCTAICLPTALISNTWNLGTPAVLDTTDYLKNSLTALENRKITPDAVLIGYLTGREQVSFVARQCEIWHRQHTKIFLDPIFADNGKLYNGMDESRIADLRQMLPHVDYVLPNSTEAHFLTNTQTPQEALSHLRTLGAHGAVITGVQTAQGHAVLLWDGQQEQEIPYTPIPGNYGGAGDAFTALFTGNILSGKSALESAQIAAETTRTWIQNTNNRPCTGLPVERFF